MRSLNLNLLVIPKWSFKRALFCMRAILITRHIADVAYKK